MIFPAGIMAKMFNVKQGDGISVYWDGDKAWYKGEILSADEHGNCRVLYDDGEQEHLNLAEVKFKLLNNRSGRLHNKKEHATSFKSLRDSLLDIEDRLPTKGVTTSRLQWWEKWRYEVSHAAENDNIEELAKLLLQIGQQLKTEITTAWWKSNKGQWKNDVIAAASLAQLECLVKDLKTKSVDWSVAKALFADTDTSDGEEGQADAAKSNHASGKRGNSHNDKKQVVVRGSSNNCKKQDIVRNARRSKEPKCSELAKMGGHSTVQRNKKKPHCNSVEQADTGISMPRNRKRKLLHDLLKGAEGGSRKRDHEFGVPKPEGDASKEESGIMNGSPVNQLDQRETQSCDPKVADADSMEIEANRPEQKPEKILTDAYNTTCDMKPLAMDSVADGLFSDIESNYKDVDSAHQSSGHEQQSCGHEKRTENEPFKNHSNRERNSKKSFVGSHKKIELINNVSKCSNEPELDQNKCENNKTRLSRDDLSSRVKSNCREEECSNRENAFEYESKHNANTFKTKISDCKNSQDSGMDEKETLGKTDKGLKKTFPVPMKRSGGSWKAHVVKDSMIIRIIEGTGRSACSTSRKVEAVMDFGNCNKEANKIESDECDGVCFSESVVVDGVLAASKFKTGVDQLCTVCKFDTADSLLLLCDGNDCSHAFHTFCLQPPLLMVPDGDWLCPYCDKSSKYFESLKTHGSHYPPKKIGKLLGRRKVHDAVGQDQIQFEYLIKWSYYSHRYNTWVPENWLLHEDRVRLMNYHRKFLSTQGFVPDFVDERKPEWLKIDRVIACRQMSDNDDSINEVEGISIGNPTENEKIEFLVKWMGLDYCDATWEKFSTELLQFAEELVERHGRASQLTENTCQVGFVVEKQPSYLKGGVLHGYQLQGLKWLLNNFKCKNNVILADEMGLGKTIQAIAFVACLKQENLCSKPVLIIAPKSTLSGWDKEFRKWAPFLNCIIYQGERPSRTCIREHEFYSSNKYVLFDILVTNFELAMADNVILQKFDWACIIVDEGHRIKNFRSRLGIVLKRLVTEFRLLMTGTPLQNSLTELFALLHFLDPSEVPDPKAAACEFSQIGGTGEDTGCEKRPENVSRIHELLQPRMLRRLKSEVLQDMLPQKKVVEVLCALAPAQRQLYVNILKKNYKLLNQGIPKGQKRSLNSILTDLKMCCNHPYLFPCQENPNQPGSNAYNALVSSSGKLQLLEKLLPKLKQHRHRVLLFSQMTKMLDLLEDFLIFLGFTYCRMDGSTSASDREQHIRNFSESDDTFIFLISTRAGSLGINLANADTVIIYDPDFNPFVDLQAQSRAHRIGQEKPVIVYQLITKCSVEEKILQRSIRKLALETIVMNQAGNETFKELHEILQHGVQHIINEEDIESTTINYTDEDIERLLNRDVETANSDSCLLHGYLGSVQAETTDQVVSPKSSEVRKQWETLLGPVVESTTEELGRGKRQRREVAYQCDYSDDDDNYSPSTSEESSSFSDYSIEKCARVVRTSHLMEENCDIYGIVGNQASQEFDNNGPSNLIYLRNSVSKAQVCTSFVHAHPLCMEARSLTNKVDSSASEICRNVTKGKPTEAPDSDPKFEAFKQPQKVSEVLNNEIRAPNHNLVRNLPVMNSHVQVGSPINFHTMRNDVEKQSFSLLAPKLYDIPTAFNANHLQALGIGVQLQSGRASASESTVEQLQGTLGVSSMWSEANVQPALKEHKYGVGTFCDVNNG